MELWKLWKKGIAFEIVMGLIISILGLLGMKAISNGNLFLSLKSGILAISVIIVVVGFVVMPIIRGLIIEWLNKKTDVVNKFINK